VVPLTIFFIFQIREERLDCFANMSSDSENEVNFQDPYRFDPAWEEMHAKAVDVQGGPEDESSDSTDFEDEHGGSVKTLALPDICVCENCRYVNQKRMPSSRPPPHFLG
jgi:hypothetical protein